MNINPGKLNKKIRIVRFIGNEDPDGFDTCAEEVVRTCYAGVSNTSGTEIIRANAEFAEAKKRFLIRASGTEINTNMYVRYRGGLYNITYINNYSDDNEYLEIWTNIKEMI